MHKEGVAAVRLGRATGGHRREDGPRDVRSVHSVPALPPPGSKGLHGDLERLKKELEKDEPNGEAIGKIVHKLGAATTKSADKCDNEKVAEQLRSLGEALTSSGQE